MKTFWSWLRFYLPQFGQGFGLIHKYGHGGGVLPIRTFFQIVGGKNWSISFIRLDDVASQKDWQGDQG